MITPKTLQDRLVVPMRQCKMKVAALIHAVRVDFSALSHWRTSGEIDQSNLIRVCHALDINADWLLARQR